MTINEYFKNPMRFRNKIVIISAKDEASRYIANFRAGFDMGLELKIKFRESYVALIDMKRDFLYEKSSHTKIECSYKVDNKYIDIISAGFECGNLSSIRVLENEYSRNATGLNVVVLKNKSLKIVDSFACDSFLDSGLNLMR